MPVGEIYFSTDPMAEPAEAGKVYTVPFEPPESTDYFAQVKCLFWRSDITHVKMIKAGSSKIEYGEVEKSESRIQTGASNQYVSDEYMQDLNGPLPSGMNCGYGNSGDALRPTYTIEQINNGAIDHRIVFNSISDDDYFGSELYFTQVCEANTDSLWNANGIEVEIGKTYQVRNYIHNNTRLGTQMVAQNVMTSFIVPKESGRTIAIQGFISSSNATPQQYWDVVILTCKDRFHIKVDFDSGVINGNGTTRLTHIPEAINGWTLIGYNEMNGMLPGCYGYSQYVVFSFKVVGE